MPVRKKEIFTLKNETTHADIRLEFSEMMNSPLTFSEVLTALEQSKRLVMQKMLTEGKNYNDEYEMVSF